VNSVDAYLKQGLEVSILINLMDERLGCDTSIDHNSQRN